jgi:hypothetical protein
LLARASRGGAGVALCWIRRALKGGDPQVAGEPPLVGPERCRERVLAGGVGKRAGTFSEAAELYASADETADLPSGGGGCLGGAAWSRWAAGDRGAADDDRPVRRFGLGIACLLGCLPLIFPGSQAQVSPMQDDSAGQHQ